MCMWVLYACLVSFSNYLYFVNSHFFPIMLLYCIDSGYFVKSTPLTPLHQLFISFADVFYWSEDVHVFFFFFFFFMFV